MRATVKGAVILLGLLGLFSLIACSDDTRPADRGTDRSPVTDLARDAGPADLAGDVAGEGRMEAGADGSRDLAADLLKPDQLAKDLFITDGPAKPILFGLVTRSVAPLLDARGSLFVVLTMAGIPFPMPVAWAHVPAADLSAPGASVSYQFKSVSAGDYSLIAFLDDNANASAPFLFADPGDLTMSAAVPIKIGVPQPADLILDKAEDGMAGGGGALKGRISSTATLVGDGLGTAYLSLHSQPPPAGFVSGTQIASVDLSAPGNVQFYYLANAAAGSYYLQVFLDDNQNAFPIGPAADTGDLIHSKPIQVQITAGVVSSQDVVLDQAK